MTTFLQLVVYFAWNLLVCENGLKTVCDDFTMIYCSDIVTESNEKFRRKFGRVALGSSLAVIANVYKHKNL